MPLNSTESTPRTVLTHYDGWAFKIFLCSTLFTIVFSVEAIHSWPSLLKHASVLLACLLPTVMVVLSRAPAWWDAKQLPKEVLWVLLVFTLGLISSLLSENSWATLKSTVLFMVSGPFIFITTRYLFESKRNVFLEFTSSIIQEEAPCQEKSIYSQKIRFLPEHC
jgi:intracellular septation protein A